MQRRYLRTRAVAEVLGVSARTVEEWRQEGGGPPWSRPKGSRVVLYDPDELDAWVRAGARRSTSDPGDGARA